jgi:hypothetical protein
MEKWWQIFFALFPFLGTILQFFLDLKKRRIAIRSIEHEIGDLGKLFSFILTIPCRVFFLLLFLIWGAALIALIGGFLYLSLRISPNGKFYVDWPIMFFNQSLLIMIVYIVLSILAMTNIVSKALLWLLRGKYSNWRHDPGWINADWQLNYGSDFKPFNTDINACEAVANNVFRAITREEVEREQDRADYPHDLTNAELANYWLIGNTIEGEIHRLGKGRSINFSDMWDAVETAATDDARPFKPEVLFKYKDQGIRLYSKIREFASVNAGALPDEPKISVRLKEVVEKLAENFLGDASKLPNSRWRKRPSIKILWRRLEQFGLSPSIAAQFTKLAKWSKLWPKMEVGPFSYPYSQNIARLLLNLRCIRVAPSITVISVDNNFRRLVSWTEDKIVKAVDKYFRELNDPKAGEFCISKLGIKLNELRLEDLIREIDYFLWSQARNRNGLFAKEGQEPWRVEGGDRLIRN